MKVQYISEVWGYRRYRFARIKALKDSMALTRKNKEDKDGQERIKSLRVAA